MFYPLYLDICTKQSRRPVFKWESRPEFMVMVVQGEPDPTSCPTFSSTVKHGGLWTCIWTFQSLCKLVLHTYANCCLLATLLTYGYIHHVSHPGRMNLGKMATQAQEWAQSYLDRELRVEKSGLGRKEKSQVMVWHDPLLLQNLDFHGGGWGRKGQKSWRRAGI